MATQFGPGPMTPAVKAIIYANVAVFLATFLAPDSITAIAGLSPAQVIERGQVWRLATYLFVHSPVAFTHILFNMLAVWMFGVDLERRWGTVEFVKYYAITGIGAGVSVVLISLLPFDWARPSYYGVTIGASGAVYGLLMAWAILFPHRQLLFMFVFPLSARVFVLLIGAIAFFSAVGTSGSGISNIAHLGGLLFGWLYLRGPRNLGPRDLRLELRYYLTRWRMERMRKKFNVHQGGRGHDDWNKRVH